MRARLYVGLGDKPICVLVGALDWIEQRAKAYAKKGFDIVIEEQITWTI